jgi:photosystem II stability/assembly factor-like uncharacterized protein
MRRARGQRPRTRTWALALPLAAAVLAVPGAQSAQPPAAPTWSPQTSGVTARLRGVSAAGDRTVWASGTGGTILRTADSGATWTRLRIDGADTLDFRDIDALDARSACALSIGNGDASRIYCTADAGAHWRLEFTNDDPRAFFDAMAFFPSGAGIAVSDSVDGRFVILTRDRRGGPWSRVAAAGLPPALANEGAFAASGTNVAILPDGHAWFGTGAAAKARVLRSPDRGHTWQVSDTPVAAGQSAGIYSVAFADRLHGVVVGGDYQREQAATHNAAITGNGGRTWTEVTGLGDYRSAVVVLKHGARPTYLAAGPTGSDLSSDGGRTWKPIDGPGFHALAVSPSGRYAWGVGENGRIARMTLK